MVRAFSRSKIAASKRGACSTVRSTSSAGVALLARRQRAHGDAGAVAVGAAAEGGADVGHLLGDRRFVELAGAEVEDAAGQRRGTGFSRRVEHRAGGEIDLDVEDRQDAGLDEVDAGAGRRHPVFDPDAGQRGLGGEQRDCCGEQLFHGHFLSDGDGDGRAARLAVERLRVEDADGQRVVAEILLRHRLHLGGGDLLQLLEHAVDLPVGDAGRFGLADLHRLAEHRVALVDLRGDQLRLDALEFLLADAVLLDAGDLGAQGGFEFGDGLALGRAAVQVEHAGPRASRRSRCRPTGRPCPRAPACWLKARRSWPSSIAASISSA